jgi:putative membrane protein
MSRLTTVMLAAVMSVALTAPVMLAQQPSPPRPTDDQRPPDQRTPPAPEPPPDVQKPGEEPRPPQDRIPPRGEPIEQDQAKAAAELSPQDRAFAEEAARGGRAEVELGQLAAQRGQHERVKEFGRRMQKDHGEANQELHKIATRKGLELPKDMGPEHKKVHDRLVKLSGADFDREYMREMVEDHEEDVKAFKRQAEQGKDADLRSFAQKTLPTLEKHLELARAINKEVGRAATTGKP